MPIAGPSSGRARLPPSRNRQGGGGFVSSCGSRAISEHRRGDGQCRLTLGSFRHSGGRDCSARRPFKQVCHHLRSKCIDSSRLGVFRFTRLWLRLVSGGAGGTRARGDGERDEGTKGRRDIGVPVGRWVRLALEAPGSGARASHAIRSPLARTLGAAFPYAHITPGVSAIFWGDVDQGGARGGKGFLWDNGDGDGERD